MKYSVLYFSLVTGQRRIVELPSIRTKVLKSSSLPSANINKDSRLTSLIPPYNCASRTISTETRPDRNTRKCCKTKEVRIRLKHALRPYHVVCISMPRLHLDRRHTVSREIYKNTIQPLLSHHLPRQSHRNPDSYSVKPSWVPCRSRRIWIDEGPCSSTSGSKCRAIRQLETVTCLGAQA